MRKPLFFGLLLAVLLTVGYFLVPKNAAVIADGKAVNREEVETIIREYIVANPEVLIESLNKYQAKQRQEQQAKSAEALKDLQAELKKDSNSPTAGNAKGDVTVVEFFDYNCGYCKKAYPTVQQLLKEDSNVNFVFKELPILSDSSELAARAALAVHVIDRGKYFAYHAKLMGFNGNKTEEQLLKFADEVGVDREKVKEKMKSEEVNSELASVKELAQKIGVQGTPAFAVGNQLHPGAVDINTLKASVAEARKGGAEKQ